jgi:hypothetical protein
MEIKRIVTPNILPNLESAETQQPTETQKPAGLADVSSSVEGYSSDQNAFSDMKIWEANRKEFLYPENWLEPELRTPNGSVEMLNPADNPAIASSTDDSDDNSDPSKIKPRK